MVVKYFEYNIYNGPFENLYKHGFNTPYPIVISTINPHSFVVAEQDYQFKNALKSSNYLVLDGVGIKILLLFLFKRVNIYNGPFIHSQIIKMFKNIPLKIFYMGSSLSVLEKIKLKHATETPLWEIQFLSPPYEAKFSEETNFSIVSSINSFSPDILFVGMTAPKQEKWVDENKFNINSKYIIPIGAVFDFYSGEKKIAPKLFQKLYLIWFYRLIFDFKHVWKRTIISLPLFFYYNLKKTIRQIF